MPQTEGNPFFSGNSPWQSSRGHKVCRWLTERIRVKSTKTMLPMTEQQSHAPPLNCTSGAVVPGASVVGAPGLGPPRSSDKGILTPHPIGCQSKDILKLALSLTLG